MKIKTFKDWMLKQFNRMQMRDMVNNGANCGFAGLTYYCETTKLYQRFHHDIWQMLEEDAESSGMNIAEFIGHFNCAKNISCHMTFVNLLVWYAAEKVAHDIAWQDENQEGE
jgi:hypothetical protein